MGKPRLIIIIRHGQSEGNRDKTIHQKTPDHRVPLTPDGHQQAMEAGEKLRALLRNDDTVHFFISPYRRTRETTEGILSGLCSNDPVPSPFRRSHIKVYEEPRLREQDFGNFQPGGDEVERLWRERAEYGHFFYRIPNGESGADVYDRVSSFNGSLWRRFSEDTMASVAILVTHGLCSRIFLMAWYHYSVEFFEDLRNINHCEFLVMKLAANGRYVLQNNLRRWSDLRRERAARKSISASAPPVNIEPIPVRRWTSNRSAHDATGNSQLPRPTRKNTAEMFKDETEVAEEVEEMQQPGAEKAKRRGSATASRGESRSRVRSTSNLRTSLNNMSLDASPSKKKPSVPMLKPYLGRDGGGSRSGAGSPFAGSDDENETTPPAAEAGHAHKDKFSSSLARALRGEFDTSTRSRDDPNRPMADALGDAPSDVEASEAEVTKENEVREIEQIIENEIRERSHGGSVY
ncbi:phosphoglycerate mutase [Exophiala viscosa]|uniref:phosphoglycerate mutase n=1 Tax=Exophiala viscosa TaxID=2486360 RepID=UPI00219411E9|nr:phosphoglycerate mutase [Exophiala viscosa]